ERIINKALEKDRNLRYQHASEIRADVQRLKRDTESGKSPAACVVPPTPAISAAPSPRARRPHAIVALAKPPDPTRSCHGSLRFTQSKLWTRFSKVAVPYYTRCTRGHSNEAMASNQMFRT